MSVSSRQRRRRSIAGIATVSLLLAQTCAAEERLTVPVKVLVAPDSAAREPVAPLVELPPQVTPAARMPQYQLDRREKAVEATSGDRFRFLVATPGKPQLFEVSLTIDGKPFRQLREERIQNILKFLEDPAAFREAQSRAAREAMTKKERLEEAATAAADAFERLQRLVKEVAVNLQPSVSESETPTKKDGSESIDPASGSPAQSTSAFADPVDIYEQFERFLSATGTRPGADEIRWMLTHWIDGPVVLLLNDNFQRFRAEQQPLFAILDADRDGVIAPEETANAVRSLTECDLNRDDVVEAAEIGTVARDPRNATFTSRTSRPMILRFDQVTDFITLLPALTACYAGSAQTEALRVVDPDGNGQINDSERHDLLQRQPDMGLRVEFDTAHPTKSKLTIVSQHQDSLEEHVIQRTDTALTVLQSGFQLELSAAQGAFSDQVSVGVVNDGYAMLPELDLNGDGRFTIREFRTLDERLRKFDQNRDGSIHPDEIAPTIRLCISLGPHAHQPLSVLRSQTSAVVIPENLPEWFLEMDKNKDLDLTRREFPGTDEQFLQLDLDQDELISHTEAAQAAE